MPDAAEGIAKVNGAAHAKARPPTTSPPDSGRRMQRPHLPDARALDAKGTARDLVDVGCQRAVAGVGRHPPCRKRRRQRRASRQTRRRDGRRAQIAAFVPGPVRQRSRSRACEFVQPLSLARTSMGPYGGCARRARRGPLKIARPPLARKHPWKPMLKSRRRRGRNPDPGTQGGSQASPTGRLST